MPGSIRCPQCGLVQMSRPECKRCGTALSPGSGVGAPADAPNPYAPPSADLSRGPTREGEDTLWRDGRILVMRRDSVLPDRCIKCNEPALGYKLRRVLYWHRPAWYWLLLVSVLIYAIVAMIVRKRATVEVGLCPVHRQRRYLAVALGVLALFGGLGGCIAYAQESDAVIYLGIILAVAGVAIAGFGHQVVRAAEIDDNYVRLKGAGADYLSPLPDVRAPVFR